MLELEDIVKAYYVLVEVLNESHLFASVKNLDSLVRDINETRQVLKEVILFIYGLDWRDCDAAKLLSEINRNN